MANQTEQCPAGNPPPMPNACPVKSSYSAVTNVAEVLAQNRGALVSPVATSQQLPIVQQYNRAVALVPKEKRLDAVAPLNAASISEFVAAIRATSLNPTTAPSSVVSQYYIVPLSLPPDALTLLQLPRLPANPDGTINVPLFSDLKRHDMGHYLSDPLPPAPSQGTDVLNINTRPQEYMTRPLWGAADTGPWMHDGRAMTLKEAILMHGNETTGSEAGPVIEAFENLPPSDQDAVVSFLETLRLPLPGSGAP